VIRVRLSTGIYIVDDIKEVRRVERCCWCMYPYYLEIVYKSRLNDEIINYSSSWYIEDDMKTLVQSMNKLYDKNSTSTPLPKTDLQNRLLPYFLLLLPLIIFNSQLALSGRDDLPALHLNHSSRQSNWSITRKIPNLIPSSL